LVVRLLHIVQPATGLQNHYIAVDCNQLGVWQEPSRHGLLLSIACAQPPLTSGTGVLVAMSVDHSPSQKPLPAEARPVFLGLQPGMTVIVRHDPMPGEPRERDWWMGQVIHCEGGARDPKAWSMFQIADVDSGVIRWVNGDLVTHVLPGGSAAAPADRCSG